MPLPQCRRLELDDLAGRDALLADGWREIEVLVTWERRGLGKPWIERCVEIARTAFVHDRLHADPMVRREDADEAKSLWVKKHFEGARGIEVIGAGGKIVGFLLQKVEGDILIIDLIAIDPAHRRKGLAELLVTQQIDAWTATIRAGTQEHNQAGMALYKKMGFEIVRRQRTFHR